MMLFRNKEIIHLAFYLIPVVYKLKTGEKISGKKFRTSFVNESEKKHENNS